MSSSQDRIPEWNQQNQIVENMDARPTDLEALADQVGMRLARAMNISRMAILEACTKEFLATSAFAYKPVIWASLVGKIPCLSKWPRLESIQDDLC